MKLLSITYKGFNLLYSKCTRPFNKLWIKWLFAANNVKYSSFSSNGIPFISVSMKGSMSIGQNFKMNNGIKGNPIGSYRKCTFNVVRGASLNIGANVGISQTALVCTDSITIGDNVKIGGGVSIYDTDFHSLDPEIRKSRFDTANRKSAPVKICDNAFIGAHSIILKGVTIGENAIVGAGSVVTKSIPSNEIWGGCPAKFIKKI